MRLLIATTLILLWCGASLAQVNSHDATEREIPGPLSTNVPPAHLSQEQCANLLRHAHNNPDLMKTVEFVYCSNQPTAAPTSDTPGHSNVPPQALEAPKGDVPPLPPPAP
jgi:hypothetical protein